MADQKIVIAGGGFAGVKCAKTLQKLLPSDQMVLFNPKMLKQNLPLAASRLLFFTASLALTTPALEYPGAAAQTTPASQPKAATQPRPAVAPKTPLLDVADLTSNALALLDDGKAEEAVQLMAQALDSALKKDSATLDPKLTVDVTSGLAACYLAEAEYDSAQDRLVKLLESMKDIHGSGVGYEKILARKRLGDAYYMGGKTERAEEQYSQALAESKKLLGENDQLSRALLDALVGSYLAQKKFAEAEPYCLRLITATTGIPRQPNPSQQIVHAWAYLNLSKIYHETGKSDADVDKCKEQALDCFRKVMRARLFMVRNTPGGNEEVEKIMHRRPDARSKMITEQLWAAVRLPHKSLPLLTWRNLRNKSWANLLCVHGLGLSSLSFDDFATRLSNRGLAVVAIDVRGFGSFAVAGGNDQLDYESTLEDIKLLLELMHSVNPGTPIFLVGESMGGGIAIHAASQYPKLVDALIASAPAAGRYDQMKTTGTVAFNFICGPHKRFNIGSHVINQATEDPQLKKEWKTDPRVRLELSPVELMKFELFMKQNVEKAEKLSNVPVLMLQGVDDRLVKPNSTFDLFQAVKTNDKDFWMIGKQEHLILEEGQCPEVVLNRIVDWLKQHVPRGSVTANASAEVRSGK